MLLQYKENRTHVVKLNSVFLFHLYQQWSPLPAKGEGEGEVEVVGEGHARTRERTERACKTGGKSINGNIEMNYLSFHVLYILQVFMPLK